MLETPCANIGILYTNRIKINRRRFLAVLEVDADIISDAGGQNRGTPVGRSYKKKKNLVSTREPANFLYVTLYVDFCENEQKVSMGNFLDFLYFF